MLIKKEFPDRPVGGRHPGENSKSIMQQARGAAGKTPPTSTQDPCRQGYYAHRGLTNQSGGARLCLLLRSPTIVIWYQAGGTKWPGRGLGYLRKPEVKMGCGWCHKLGTVLGTVYLHIITPSVICIVLIAPKGKA